MDRARGGTLYGFIIKLKVLLIYIYCLVDTIAYSGSPTVFPRLTRDRSTARGSDMAAPAP
eukprot:scaffold10770_cov66-Phaeocystis_antarctica.AAC.2